MRTNKFIYILLIVFPFIFLAPLTFQYLEVGNDFELYYYVYKKYIFELLKSGHLPLWSPTEGAGYSLVFNPLAQYIYIPTWVLYLISFFLGDLSKYSFLIYTISAISIFNVGLFLYLRTFNINYKIALTTVLITSLSLKVTELLRFPNALHAFAWFPWILYGFNFVLLNKGYKKSFLIIFISSFMLLTAGYPYYIFYGFILFLFYFIFLLLKPVKENLFFEEKKNIISNKNFILKCFYPSIFALILSSPWLLKISQLMNITRGRNTSDINFSYLGSSNIYDQIGSWIYPPFSMAEGWYYFGATSVFIIVVLTIFSIFFSKSQSSQDLKFKYFIFFFIFLFLISYQFSNSKDSLIFLHIWQNIDFIQNFRFWLRMNIILVPVISVILALSINKFINILNENNYLVRKKLNYVIVTSFIVISFTQIFFIFFSDYENLYWDTWQLKRINYVENLLPGFFSFIANLYKSFIYPIYILVSFILIFSMINNNCLFNFFRKKIYLFFCLILFLSFSELFFLSNIQWSIPYRYYDDGNEKLQLKENYNFPNENALQDLNIAFLSNRVSIEKSGSNKYEGNTYYRNNKKFNINYINHWGNENHTKLFDKFFQRNGKFKKDLDFLVKKNIKYFYGMDDSSRKIFYSKTLNHNDIFSFLRDSRSNEIKNNFYFNLVKYNGDELIINIKIDDNGWVSFIDTWDSNWKVYINKEEKKLMKLFGAYKSVQVQKGISEIRFVYKPFNFDFR